MSGHGQHDTGADPHAGHDDHHETSSDDFPADEPHSPGWLPLLGGGLLLAGIFAFVVFGSDDTSTAAGEAPAPAANAPAQLVRPSGLPAPRPLRAPGGIAMPANHDQLVREAH